VLQSSLSNESGAFFRAYTDFYVSFLWLTTEPGIFFAIFKLIALTCREVGLRVLSTDIQYVISFLGRKSGQQEIKEDITHVGYSEHRREGLKTSVSHATFVYITSLTFLYDFYCRVNRRIQLTLPPNSNHSMIHLGGLIQLFCLYIFPCNELRLTNCTIIILQMSHRMFWTGS